MKIKTAPAFNQKRFTSILRIASAGALVFAGAAMALVAAKPSAPDATNGGPINGVYIVHMKSFPGRFLYWWHSWIQRHKTGQGPKDRPTRREHFELRQLSQGETRRSCSKSPRWRQDLRLYIRASMALPRSSLRNRPRLSRNKATFSRWHRTSYMKSTHRRRRASSGLQAQAVFGISWAVQPAQERMQAQEKISLSVLLTRVSGRRAKASPTVTRMANSSINHLAVATEDARTVRQTAHRVLITATRNWCGRGI